MEKNKNRLTVSFKKKEEETLIKFLIDNGHIDNFSYYVKNLIKNDMNKVESNQKEEIENKKRKSKFVIG